MKYYYFKPINPQYFFSSGFLNYELTKNFYKPYSLRGYFFWFIYKNFFLYHFFKKKDLNKYFDYDKLLCTVGDISAIAFNLGTRGPEQKTTVIVINKQTSFFIKYGQTNISINNIKNEYVVLKSLSSFNFVPKVIEFLSDTDSVMLKTSILKGKRLTNLNFTQILFDNLIVLSNHTINLPRNEKYKLIYKFAHGDYCPWNMFLSNNKIMLFDWEMAGNYTLGYDLFTFLFQTNFVLNKQTTIGSILKKNMYFIDKYYQHFNVIDWTDYLIAFAEIKVDLEKNKKSNGLYQKYILLLDHVKKA